ncbi:MAG TPA: HAMP domain-containing sensor histidine kinase [Candidatus Saccharimonadales bacterium]|nr:HAMP domain-containing sensor histidine kinase [Candidatus Saccharimonadales bacterium]
MAVVRLADYYRNHRRSVIVATVGMQILVTAALVILLFGVGLGPLVVGIYVILPVVILQVFAFIVILSFTLAPLKVLSTVVTHVSKEPSDVKPPNLNGTYHERTGLKRMVQTIYDLAVAGPADATTPANRSAELTDGFLNDLPVGVIALDASHSIRYFNQAAPVHTDEQGNQSIELLFESNDPFDRWLDEAENKSLMTQRAWTRIANVLPDQPNRRVFDVIVNYQKERPSGFDTIIICVDRTDHYAVDEEDMDFIALAAHELRGPITVIRGYLDVLAQETDLREHPDHQVLLDRLDVSAARLAGYVGNILNVAKYDRRHLKLHLKEDRLSAIYQTVADDLALRARAQARSLSVNLPTDLPTVAADRNSLSEVMANLIDNAIKYSNEGGQVIVSAAVDGDFVKFVVQDSGIGIPASVISNLFTKFYRSHRSATNVTGTGLGLYISKAIIESHGGKIGVKSVEGEGSVFSFSVPIYATVKDRLLSGNNNESAITMSAHGWIKNHSMYES